jgi:hypothetical protein
MKMILMNRHCFSVLLRWKGPNSESMNVRRENSNRNKPKQRIDSNKLSYALRGNGRRRRDE